MPVDTRSSHTLTQRLLPWCFGALAGGIALWLLGDVILLVFAATLLAVGLRGGAERIGALFGWRPRAGLLLLCVSIVLVVVGAVLLGGTRVADQGNQLWGLMADVAERTRDWLEQYRWGRSLVAGASPQATAQEGQRLASGLGLALVGLLGVVANVVIAVVAAIYFAASPQIYVDGVLRLLPRQRRRRIREVLQVTGTTLRHWLSAQAMAMLLVAVASFVGLMLLGVPMALLLALIAGLTNFVPYVGPIVGAVPAVLVAAGAGADLALWVTLLFVGIQVVEGNFLQPLLQERMTKLAPAMTILSQTLLGALLGVPGVILATPLLAVAKDVVRMLYVEDIIGDRADAPLQR